MNDEIQALKEWALSTFVQKDACSDRHEKTDEKINTLIVDSTQTKVKLSLIQWLGATAAASSIAGLIAGLYSAIFK